MGIQVRALLMAGAISVAGISSAMASPGCTALNGQAGIVNSGSLTGTGFSAGDTITGRITINGSGIANIGLVDLTTAAQLVANSPAPFTYVVPANTGDTFSISGAYFGPTDQQVWSCVNAAPGGGTGSTNSQIIEQMRQTFSMVAAQSSANAMGDSVNGALNDAFGNGGATQMGDGRFATTFAALDNAKARDDTARNAYAALGYGKDRMVTKAAPAAPVPPSPWHVWIDARYLDFNDRSDSANKFDGHNTNLTGGLSYRFNRDFIAGIVTGYEDFKYDVNSLNAFLKGDGWHAGGYFGWKFWDRLRLDGMLTYGQIDYGAQAGAVTGGWNADRITGMLRIAGRYGFGTYYVEPSARVTWAHESQDAFTDSAGIAHGNFKFDVGRASLGAEAGTPLVWSNVIVTPYLGLFGDYRFGDETIAAASVVPNLENGWTARVTGGLSWQTAGGLTGSLGAEYGGLGDTIQYWQAKARVGVKF